MQAKFFSSPGPLINSPPHRPPPRLVSLKPSGYYYVCICQHSCAHYLCVCTCVCMCISFSSLFTQTVADLGAFGYQNTEATPFF